MGVWGFFWGGRVLESFRIGICGFGGLDWMGGWKVGKGRKLGETTYILDIEPFVMACGLCAGHDLHKKQLDTVLSRGVCCFDLVSCAGTCVCDVVRVQHDCQRNWPVVGRDA